MKLETRSGKTWEAKFYVVTPGTPFAKFGVFLAVNL
jgi:hypothetical protein